MRPVPFSRGLSIVLATAIGAMPVAAPAHVHETTTPDGHHQALTHRHADSHVGHTSEPDNNPVTLEDARSVVATLEVAFALPSGAYRPVVSVEAVAAVLPDDVEPLLAVPCEFIERLIHGPPRAPTSPRGPPAQSFL